MRFSIPKSIPIYLILLSVMGVLQGCQYIDSPLIPYVTIAGFPDGKEASFALTFDDNCPSSFNTIVPLLNKYGYKATFFIIAGRVTSDAEWLKWKNLSDNGFEIGNHTMNHFNLPYVKSINRLMSEINDSHSLIEQKIGLPPFSFAHPGHSTNKTVDEIVFQKHYASRVSPARFCCMWGPLSKSPESYFEEFLENGIRNNYLMALAAHGVNDGWEPVTSHWLEHGLKMLKAREDKIAIDHFGNLSKYEIEKDSSHIEVHQSYNKLSITLETPLDTSVFNYPLTMIVENHGNVKRKITPLEGTKIMSVAYREDQVLIKLMPKSKLIIQSAE